MRRLAVIIVSSLLIFALKPSYSKSTSDSLIAALDSGVDDTTEVNIYYQLILRNEYSNPKLALKYSRLIIKHPLNQSEYYQARNYINLGKIFKNLSQFDSAVVYMLKGIEIAERNDELKTQAMGYNSLGVIFKSNSDWDEALKYYRLSNDACTQMNYGNGMAMTLNNIGTIYDAQSELDSALYYYNKALKIARDSNLLGAKAIALNNLGEVYAKQNKETEAIPYFLETLECDQKTGNKMGMAYTLLNLANSHKVLNNFDSSYHYFELARIVIEEIENPQLMANYYFGLSDAYEKNGRIKKSLEHFKRFQKLNDSIYNAEKSNQIIEMKTKYETEKKELEIQNLSQENEIKELEIKQSQQRFYWTGAASIALLLIGLLGFLQFRNRQKRKYAEALVREQQKGIDAVIVAEENERKRIAKDLHDGIGQQLSGLKLFYSKLRPDIEKTEPQLSDELEKFEEVLDSACTDVRSISHQMMPKVLLEKGLVEALEDMLNKSLGLGSIHYIFEHFKLQKRYNERIEISIYRICQELINNIIKHSNASEVSVQLYENKNSLILHIEDNGIGFDSKIAKEGIGQLNMSSRINTLNGKFSVDSEPGRGTSATIKIPL